ncbi:hypothetical protein AMTRI_Chr06g197670 [Amborella trichopoda]
MGNRLYIYPCGYSVGNELTDYDILLESKVPFAHRMGLISDKLYEDLRISCQGNYWNSIHPDCLRNMEDYENRPMVLFNSESSRRDLHAQQISLIQHHLNLTLRGYRAFIYSGDHDMTAPYIGILEWIRRLNYTELESWRPCKGGNQCFLNCRYSVQYEHNLLFATFKSCCDYLTGAGHTATEFTPRESLVAFQR